MKNIVLEGIYTHLSSADEKDRRFTLAQLKEFDSIAVFLKQQKLKIPYLHVLNSAGIMNYSQYHYDMVRPGIMLYGYFPDNRIRKSIGLKPCMDLKSCIVSVKKHRKNTPVGYGHTYYTRRSEVIASISCGYGDGINRLLSGRGYVLFQDMKCLIRGRICMDQIMVNMNSLSDPVLGDMVTIFGRDKKKLIRLEHAAEELKTVPYEILCQIGERVKRVYIE